MERGAHLQRLFYLSPGSIHTAPIERNIPPPEILSDISASPQYTNPLQVAQMSTQEDPELSFHNPVYPVWEPSLEALGSESLQREMSHPLSKLVSSSQCSW